MSVMKRIFEETTELEDNFQTILNHLWELIDDFDLMDEFSEDLLTMEELKEFNSWFDSYGYTIQTVELYLENMTYDTNTIVMRIKESANNWLVFDLLDRIKPIESEIEYWEISDISELRKIFQ